MKTQTSGLIRFISRASRGITALCFLIAAVQSGHAALTHRYSFTSDASDSVGGANGTLMNGANIQAGAVYFIGGTSGPGCDYVELPPGLVSNYTSVTFEFWMSADVNGTWGELFGFGTQTSGGAGANMLTFIPHSGSAPNDYRMSYAQASPGYNDEYVVNGVGVLDSLGPVSVACVYDPPTRIMSLYTNGVLVSSLVPSTPKFSLTNIYNVRSWLARSLYNGDNSYAGSIDEFRIYNSALGPLQIAVNNAAGPDTIVTNLVVNSILWNVAPAMTIGARQDSTVTFNTANYGSFTVSGSTEARYLTSDPSVVTVSPQGRLFAMKVGTASVSAYYGNQTNTVVISVGQPTLAHRYSFTSDASDSVGGANGTLMGSAAINNGAVVLNSGANASSDPGVAYVDLPNNLLKTNTTITIESWVTDTGSRNWARIWDFGNSAGGEDVSNGGSRYMFLSLPAGGGDLYGTIHVSDRAGGDQGVGWAGGRRPPVNKKSHIVWASDAAHQTGWLYVDGALVGINTNLTLLPTDIGNSVNDWIGRSQYNDPMFNGAIDEFRIWNGSLTPLQVAINAAAGPDRVGPVDPGALQTVHLVAETNMVRNAQRNVSLYADFAGITNVNVSTLGTTYTSSDTNVVTVSAGGAVTAVAAGTATLTATYSGKSDQKTITVVIPPVTLTHRWSFNETSGTTVADSVGTANGTLSASGTALDGTNVTLDGISGYVSLPAHLIDGYDALTVETWVTVDANTAADGAARLFSFGSVDGANEVSVTALSGGRNSIIRYAGPPSFTAVRQKGLNTLGKIHLVAVYNPPVGTIDLYVNGSWQNSNTNAAFSLATITNLVSQLGANLGATNFTAATFDEFRIYKGALDLYAIRTSMAAGPGNAVTDGGTPTSLALAVDAQMVLGSKQTPHVHANYAAMSNVDLTEAEQVAFTSSDPAVIKVTSNGRLQAVAGGSATITATLKGKTDTKTVTVFPKQTMLVHRYSFTNGITDSVGAQDGKMFGNAYVDSGELTLDGDMNSYVELPSHLINSYDAVSIEAWATFGANAVWPRLYDFGHYNPAGDGGSRPYVFLCPHTGGATASIVLSDGAEAGLVFSSAPLDGLSMHLVVVYDPPSNTESVYTNGVLAASGTLNGKILANVDDLKCWLGRSMYAGDNGLNGSINEFRIYAGALTAAQISADTAAGPEKVVLAPPVNEAPKLSAGLSANNLVISWPASATGFTLQNSAVLGTGATWAPTGKQPVVVNGMNQVTVPTTDTAMFYRLVKQ